MMSEVNGQPFGSDETSVTPERTNSEQSPEQEMTMMSSSPLGEGRDGISKVSGEGKESFVSSLPLKRQMTLRFSVSFGICLTLVAVTCMLVTGLAANTLESRVKTSLSQEVRVDIASLTNLTAHWLQLFLHTAAIRSVGILSAALDDTGRPDYSYYSGPSFLDAGFGSIPTPLSFDPRRGENYSFAHSMCFLPAKEAPVLDRTTFSSALNLAIDRSSHLDAFFLSTFLADDNFFSLYTGFDEAGLFRFYPGGSVTMWDSARTYDPRVRPWYVTLPDKKSGVGDNASLGTPQFSTPYPDFGGGSWLITISQRMQHTGAVAGVDVRLTSLAETIRRFRFLESGKVTLFERSGVVVADRSFNQTSGGASEAPTWRNLTSPALHADAWEAVSSTKPKSTRYDSYVLGNHGETYVLVTTGVEGFEDKYLFTVFLPEKEILRTHERVVNQNEIAIIVVSSVVCICFVALMIIVLVVNDRTAENIVAPFTRMNSRILKMMAHIGHEELNDDGTYAGKTTTGLGAGGTQLTHVLGGQTIRGGLGQEAKDLTKAFNKMIRELQNCRHDPSITNPYYYNAAEPLEDSSGGRSSAFYPPLPAGASAAFRSSVYEGSSSQARQQQFRTHIQCPFNAKNRFPPEFEDIFDPFPQEEPLPFGLDGEG